MINSDKTNFKNIMNTACATLGKPSFDADSLNLYFAILESYSFEQVQQALFKSLTSQDSKYGITPALIVKFLGVKESRELNWQDVIEMARKPTTPMAVLARIHIKSYYLDSFKPMEIKHRADTFLDGLDEMKARAMAGDYTQHEIVTMIDRGVKVSSPFMVGMDNIGSNPSLRLKYNEAIQSPLHIENVARNESRERNGLENEAGKARARAEIAKALINTDKPADIEKDNTAELKAEFDKKMDGIK